MTKLVLNPEFFFEKTSKLSLELIKYVEKVLRKCQFCEKNRGGSILRQIRKSAICVRMLFSAKLLTFTPIKVLEYFFLIKMSPVVPWHSKLTKSYEFLLNFYVNFDVDVMFFFKYPNNSQYSASDSLFFVTLSAFMITISSHLTKIDCLCICERKRHKINEHW